MRTSMLCSFLLLTASFVFAAADPVQLDISSAFNVDAWCGPLECQGFYTYCDLYDPDQDLAELQGDLYSDSVGWFIIDQSLMMVGASTSAGYGETYSISGQWFDPAYISDSQGTPEDGVLTGSDGRSYHVASVLGNDTLSGNWLEMADPYSSWDIKENAVVVGSAHAIATWQIDSVTIELPSSQKGPYSDVNFVLTAMDLSDRARNIRIVALYGSTGSDTEILYSFSTSEGGSGPMMYEQDGGTDFDIVHSMTKACNPSAGTTGNIGNYNSSLYEFDTPLELDDTKDLWGFLIEDVNPTLTNNARGLAVFAATATPLNVDPVADAGSDQNLTDTDDSGSETVSLDGSGSYDSDGSIASYIWTENSSQIATGSTASVSLSVGTHQITLTVTDDQGATDTDTVTITISEPVYDPVQLDISSAFNVDAWCGPLECQGFYTYCDLYDPDQDLAELQGDLYSDSVGWFIIDQSLMMVGASTSAGYGETYSISGQWFDPAYISDSQGTPEDGVLTGGDGRSYHVASVLGNDTLSGNWLEVADPYSSWDIMENAVVVGSAHAIATWQIDSVTIELPAGQKGPYSDVNFVLTAMDLSDRARNIRIVALYGSTGSDTEVLYSFSTAEGGSGPQMYEQDGGTDFDIVHNMTKACNPSAGTTGNIGNYNSSLYEFDTPLELDDTKDLWGFLIEDVNPTLTNNARGLAVFAATATPASSEPEPVEATYYIDYVGGSDSNNGTSASTPWQHCPGDENATSNAASATLSAGDVILFKGGVIYRGEIDCLWSGSSGNHIIYDGNSDESWGTGRAIIDGSQAITGWTQCQSSAEVDGNPNYANIYWTYADAGATAFNTDFFEDDTRLHPAQDPNLTDPFYHDDLGDFETFNSYTDTTIIDTDYFTQAASDYWDGSTYIYIHGGNNTVLLKEVTGYVPASNQIQFESLGTTAYSSFAMVNSLKILDVPGELVVREDQTDANGRPKVYMWPTESTISGKTYTVAVEKGSFNLGDESYLTVRGFKLTKSISNYKAGVYNQLNVGVTDLLIEDNLITYHSDNGINIDRATNCIVSGNEVTSCRGRGIILTEVTDSSIEYNYVHDNLETAIDYYTAIDSQIVGNLVANNRGLHANGITCYIYCEGVTIYGNTVYGGRIACTVGDCEDMLIAYNILDGNGSNYAFADWRNQDGLYLYNNVIQGGGSTIATNSVDVYAINNIMSGSQIVYRGGSSSYNIYTELSWTQDSNNLETGEFEADPDDLWVDPENGDYHLKSTSPAINAGTDVGLDEDFDGNSVPNGTYPDIGAFEYQN